MEKVTVWIPEVGRVEAVLLQRYADGDVRVTYNGRQYICKEVA